MKKTLGSLYQKYIRIIPGIQSYFIAALIVLIFGLSVTAFSWYLDKKRDDERRSFQTLEQASSVRKDILTRLSVYEQILIGTGGLFGASENVSQTEFSEFIKQFNVEKAYPGINGIGFAQSVENSEAADYIATQQAAGKPNFSITPGGQRSVYAPITYTQSFVNVTATNAFGFDILSEPKRKAAAEKTKDSGVIATTEKLQLFSDRNTTKPGFITYQAIYDKGAPTGTLEQRRANIRGYVFAGYRAEDFFNQAIRNASLTAYSDIQIFDGKTLDQNSLFYQTKNFSDSNKASVSQPFTINALGREWTYRFSNPVNFDQKDQKNGTMILIGGATISLALAGFIFLVMLTRARAIVYAKQNEAQQAKDDLLSLASHQLRTPATAVKQYLGMIMEGYSGEVNKQLIPSLQKAYISNERQLETINQILYVAKADAGRLSINRNSFDINYLIDDISDELSDFLEEKNQTIKVDRPNKKLMVYADEASIRMVIENLISNASKYSHPNSVVKVKAGRKQKEIYISITDQGVGIAEDDFDKLFKKFSRIDNELSLQVGGSGIGLYIDNVLIELHGGRIEVESTLGKGSTFTIFLPKQSASNLTDGGRKDS